MGTVFHQGSMFSSLVALTPPILPSTLESVVDSKIQIITTSAVTLNYFTTSLLKYQMHDMGSTISTVASSAKLLSTLKQLESRMIFIDTESAFFTGFQISAGTKLEFEDKSVTPIMDTFAIINIDYELDNMLAGVGLERVPYVLRHIESSRFFREMATVVTRAFMSSAVSQISGLLAQSGVYKMWRDLELMKDLVSNIKGFTSTKQYRRVVVPRFFGVMNEVMFEEGKKVSLFAFEGTIRLCAAILSMTIVSFIREFVSYETLRCIARECRQGICRGCRALKEILYCNWENGNYENS